MKKKIIVYVICGLLIFLLAALVLFNLTSKNNTKKLKKVTMAEVAHTIFYAPQYVAIEKGYFKEYGIDLEVILTPGADKVSAAVLSGDAQIGFSGSEATIYVYNGGEKDYLKTFAQLTQKDGTFIVSRKNYKNFKLSDLKGKDIIGGRAAGMPEMTLEYALKQNGIDPKKDVNIDTSIEFAAMGGAFMGGQGDFVTLFEPTALQVERQGYGHVVASVGELGGVVPYTSYSARKSYIKNNKEVITNFTKAIQKGLDYVDTHSDKEVAKAIINQFPDTSVNDLTSIIERYKTADSWLDNPYIDETLFKNLEDIIINSGEIKSYVPYTDLIINAYKK